VLPTTATANHLQQLLELIISFFTLCLGDSMSRLKHLTIPEINPDQHNARQDVSDEELRPLAENMLTIGQQIPALVVERPGGGFDLLDGHRRYKAACLAGIPSLLCMVMQQNYTEADWRVAQLSIEAHKKAMSFIERSDLLVRIKAETNWSVTDLAKAVGLDQGTVTKLLSLQRLNQELQALVHSGGLRLEEAYFISREPDTEKQKELARAAPGLSRDQLRQRVKPSTPKPADNVKTAKAVFVRPTGDSVAVQGKELSNRSVIEMLQELVRDLKRAVADNLDIKTVQQVFKDRAKAAPAI
jgi:ParB/RepB/Spo0J family partition protein